MRSAPSQTGGRSRLVGCSNDRNGSIRGASLSTITTPEIKPKDRSRDLEQAKVFAKRSEDAARGIECARASTLTPGSVSVKPMQGVQNAVYRTREYKIRRRVYQVLEAQSRSMTHNVE